MPDLYPMVRGRLMAVNGKPVSEADYAEERAQAPGRARVQPFLYEGRCPAHNTVIAGTLVRSAARARSRSRRASPSAWAGSSATSSPCSVGGERFSARITLAAQAALGLDEGELLRRRAARACSKASRRASSARSASSRATRRLVNELAARFPNMTVVDVAAAVRQAQGVIDQLINAVQFVFLFALGAGLLVLYSALVATEDERRREAAVMRVYGASRAQVTGSQRAEFLAMGVLAGPARHHRRGGDRPAAGAARVRARPAAQLALWIAGPLAGLALLSLNAWLSSRKVLRASPALTLRDSV